MSALALSDRVRAKDWRRLSSTPLRKMTVDVTWSREAASSSWLIILLITAATLAESSSNISLRVSMERVS
jgi:hypothetical protein